MNEGSFEYDELVSRLRDNHTRRNQAQLFAFTASFALFAVLISPEAGNDSIASIMYLIPYVALLPLSCKITYSRICHARIDAYLSVAYPGRRLESDFERAVPDLGRGCVDRIITYGVNFEPLLIGLIASSLAIWSAFSQGLNPIGATVVVIALALPALVGVILNHGLDYSGIRSSFVKKWGAVLPANRGA